MAVKAGKVTVDVEVDVKVKEAGVERRFIPAAELRIDEAEGDDEKLTITGYASVFGSQSLDMGFREVVHRGAFKRSLSDGADVRALVDHDPSRLLGRTKSGTLSLKTDKTGLRATINPPDTTAGRDTVESLRRGDLDGMSFAFRTVSDKWETKDGQDVRTLLDVDLLDVSIVTYPAYPDTSVQVRSHDQWEQDNRDELTAKTETMRMRLELAERQ